jgi:hypothetical protein
MISHKGRSNKRFSRERWPLTPLGTKRKIRACDGRAQAIGTPRRWQPPLPPQARPRVPLGAFAVSGPNFAEGRFMELTFSVRQSWRQPIREERPLPSQSHQGCGRGG